MRGFYFLVASAATLLTLNVSAQERHEKLDSVIVSASRAGKNTPVTYSMVGKKELRKSNPINSLPMILNLQPSVVAINEGGTGLGYSKLSVRGVSGSQINVTLNGITLNDSESQEVFWVNIPALPNILSSVQLQRGLGTSASGPGAFGASINMNTSSIGSEPTGHFEVGRGSYSTTTNLVSVSTGLMDNGLYFSGAYSRDYTDGYMRNAKAKVQSAFATFGWIGENNSIKFTYLMGNQHSGSTWYGVPSNIYDKDRKYNPAGEYSDSFGNPRYYDNETDNYTQHHAQVNYTHKFNDNLVWSTTYNFTKGDGYYEQYKAGKKFSKYSFDKLMQGQDGQKYKKSDFITRKMMDNTYNVINTTLKYRTEKLDLVGGAYFSIYDGDHEGKVRWSDVLGSKFDYDKHYWYLNNGNKKEANVFFRGEYRLADAVTLFADLQYRYVFLKMYGPDDEGVDLSFRKHWNFFNPRMGASWSINDKNRIYGSIALGHREPGRSDLKENIITANLLDKSDKDYGKIHLKPESMIDYELGYNFATTNFSANVNLYYMDYKDMLLQTGRLSNSGYAIKDNVGGAYRRGIELQAAYQMCPEIRLSGNATFSQNKIKDNTYYYTSYNNSNDWGEVRNEAVHTGKTTMLKSPSFVSMVQLVATPFKRIMDNAFSNASLIVDWKYVGSQYWDNTQSADRKIPSYNVMNLALNQEFKLKNDNVLGFSAYVNNVLNKKYYADAWAYRAFFRADKTWYQEDGIFPQATTNYMFKVYYKF